MGSLLGDFCRQITEELGEWRRQIRALCPRWCCSFFAKDSGAIRKQVVLVASGGGCCFLQAEKRQELPLQEGRVKGPPLQTVLEALHGAGTGVMGLEACKPSTGEDEAQALLKV